MLLALLALFLLAVGGCGEAAVEEGPGNDPASEPAAGPLPCFLPGGKPVWRIKQKKRAADGKIAWSKNSVEVTDATVERFAAQGSLQRPGGSENYARMRALETAIRPQAAAYLHAGPEKVADASRRVREVMKRLRAGEDFAKLARELSDDLGSREKGGSIDWISRGLPGNQMAMAPSFEWVLWSTPVGSLSQPFATMFGFHVLFVHEERPSEKFPGHTDRRTSQILCSFNRAAKGDTEFRTRFQAELQKAVDSSKVEILDPAWESYVPGVFRVR